MFTPILLKKDVQTEDYFYSSASDYSYQKGLIDDVIVFIMFDI
ncbi:hypothetical protein [Flavobacterium bizetiae]|nr:hypothetical protein [Flavobacterium bizetiae]